MLPSTSNRSCPYPAKGFETEITVHECQLRVRGKDRSEAWAILDEVRGSIETLDSVTHSQNLLYDNGSMSGRMRDSNTTCRPTRDCPPSSGQCS